MLIDGDDDDQNHFFNNFQNCMKMIDDDDGD